MNRLIPIGLLFVCAGIAQGQTPQTTPQKQPPTPQPPPANPPQQPPPPVQLYRLVPVESSVPAQGSASPIQCVTAPPQQVQYVQAPVQQYGFTTQSTGQRTIVLGPGPLSLSAAWVGQRLATLGKSHVWTINHQVIRPVNPQPAPPVQTVQYTVSMPQPVAQPPVQVQLVQQPVQQPVQVQYVQQPVQQVYRSEEAPPPPVVPKPTPQAQIPPPVHKLWGMLGH